MRGPFHTCTCIEVHFGKVRHHGGVVEFVTPFKSLTRLEHCHLTGLRPSRGNQEKAEGILIGAQFNICLYLLADSYFLFGCKTDERAHKPYVIFTHRSRQLSTRRRCGLERVEV